MFQLVTLLNHNCATCKPTAQIIELVPSFWCTNPSYGRHSSLNVCRLYYWRLAFDIKLKLKQVHTGNWFKCQSWFYLEWDFFLIPAPGLDRDNTSLYNSSWYKRNKIYKMKIPDNDKTMAGRWCETFQMPATYLHSTTIVMRAYCTQWSRNIFK